MVAKELVGVLAILGGLVIIILSLGDLLFRVAIALVGLLLISYGMSLRNEPTLSIWVRRTFYRMHR